MTATDGALARFARFESSGRLEHMPALDGLRGLAVAVVVLFHGNWSWAEGGYLGVSLFFTLSGFLITSLLLSERAATGSVALSSFWTRRFARLLPAAWITIAATAVAGAMLDQYSAADRGDAVAALANVANWRFWAAGSSYGDLFGEPSPFRHFWSLAIEEQIYVILPIVVVGLTARSLRGRRALAVVLGAATAVSVVLSLMFSNPDRVYYGTDTRSAELLLGALLAVAVSSPTLRRSITERQLVVTAIGWLSIVALVGLGVAVATVPVTAPVVSNGGLALTGLISTTLVLGSIVGVGVVARLLSLAPLRWLGRVSYGVYLVHWPLLVFLTERRTGLGHAPRFVLVVALSLGLAALSSRCVETPIRRAALHWRPRYWAAGAVALVGVVIVATVMPTSAQQNLDQELADATFGDLINAASEWEGLGETVPTMAAFGDSVAFTLSYPLSAWSQTSRAGLFLGGDVQLGCGIGRGGYEDGVERKARSENCDAWPQRWAELTDTDALDIAIVHTGQWEIVDRMIEGDDQWRTVGDPIYDEYLLGELREAQELLSRNGALVIWVNLAHYGTVDTERQSEAMRRSHASERVDRFNELLAQLVAEYPDSARLLDLASALDGRENDDSLRYDGAHFNERGSEAFGSEYLGPEILQLWNSWRATQPEAPAVDQ